jgi:hypothetical protein
LDRIESMIQLMEFQLLNLEYRKDRFNNTK